MYTHTLWWKMITNYRAGLLKGHCRKIFNLGFFLFQMASFAPQIRPSPTEKIWKNLNHGPEEVVWWKKTKTVPGNIFIAYKVQTKFHIAVQIIPMHVVTFLIVFTNYFILFANLCRRNKTIYIVALFLFLACRCPWNVYRLLVWFSF